MLLTRAPSSRRSMGFADVVSTSQKRGALVPDVARERVRDEITTAFGSAPYPGDEEIVSMLIIGGQLVDDPERKEIKEAFRGSHWTAVSHETLMRNRDSLPFFTPAGLRFFLPAYLLAALDGEKIEAPRA